MFFWWAVAAIVIVFSAAAPAGLADCGVFLPGQQVGTVPFGTIYEASGLAASRQNTGVLWTHNDSGAGPRAYAMGAQGNHLGVYNLTPASATDWEDMAVGPGPVAGTWYLYLGDIGDNSAVRQSIQVYRAAEPTVSATQSPVDVNLTGTETITLRYPDGARDAETLMVDPLTRDLYIVTKRESLSRVYRAAYPQSTTQTITMEYLGQLPWGGATGGDISPDGQEILVRRYFSASLWSRPAGGSIWDAFATTPCTVPLVSEPEGEAISFK